MTTTTISASTKAHSLTALFHDAFHVRAWLTHGEGEPKVNSAARVSKPRRPSNDDQTTMLVTFAGRYGARY